MGNIRRFPLAKAQALPAAYARPAGAAAANDLSKESGTGPLALSRAAPPPRRPSFLEVASNCIELARFAINGEFVEDISVLRKKCDEDLLFAAASESHDGAMRDAMWMLLTNIKHFCEADSARRPVWARAIAVNKATLRDLYHLAVRA